jgi:hypothetical protein
MLGEERTHKPQVPTTATIEQVLGSMNFHLTWQLFIEILVGILVLMKL